MNTIALRRLVRDAFLLLVIAIAAVAAGQLLGKAWTHWQALPEVTAFDPAAIADVPGDGPVMITDSTCPVCASARSWLHTEGVDYRELVIDQSVQARQIAEHLGVRTVPTFLIGDTRINGFVLSELEPRLGVSTR